MSGTPSPKQSSSSGSAASFIKVVEQLIQSDDEEILIRKMSTLQISFPVLKKMTPTFSNQQKLSIFMRDNNFRHQLHQKLLEQFGNQHLPNIKFQLYSIRYRSIIQQELQQADLVKIFLRFGKISFIYVDKAFGYVKFQSLISSYLAIKTLNQFEVINDLLKLQVRWCKPDQQTIAEHLFSAKFNSITKAFQNSQKQEKFNSKYLIYLQCSAQFKLAQKIIGPKGNNMKKIFQKISQQQKIASIKDIQKNLKMRLRGKGSGYCQGPSNEQSDQILNLCVSSKQKKLYDSACISIQKVLQKLAKDYKFEFQRIYKRPLQGTVYRKMELQKDNSYIESKLLSVQQLVSNCNLNLIQKSVNKRPSIKYIQDQINLRNKARREGRYQEADSIREHLKNRSILLVDGTGRKGSYATTWNYIGQ